MNMLLKHTGRLAAVATLVAGAAALSASSASATVSSTAHMSTATQSATAQRPSPALVTPDTWTYYSGSTTISPYGDCKAWANYSGHYVQMLGESWGANCTFYLVRYHNGVQDLYDERVQDGAGTLSTNGYWDDSAEGYYMDIYACDGSACTETSGL